MGDGGLPLNAGLLCRDRGHRRGAELAEAALVRALVVAWLCLAGRCQSTHVLGRSRSLPIGNSPIVVPDSDC